MSQTIGDINKLIRKAKAVYIRPFFGVKESWVKISKPEAFKMFSMYDEDKTLFECCDFDHYLQLEGGDYKELYLG